LLIRHAKKLLFLLLSWWRLLLIVLWVMGLSLWWWFWLYRVNFVDLLQVLLCLLWQVLWL
jgi:hypothetical protein